MSDHSKSIKIIICMGNGYSMIQSIMTVDCVSAITKDIISSQPFWVRDQALKADFLINPSKIIFIKISDEDQIGLNEP